MQIRTEIQHIWATAVETVGTFLSQASKSSQGQDAWLRFFALMGSAVALREGTILVPDTHHDPQELLAELRTAAEFLQVEARLQAYGAALQTVGAKESADARYFLLELDAAEQKLQITPFKASEADIANNEYLRIEKSISGKPGCEAVLVSVSSLEVLRRAYPSYFLDTERFLTLLREAQEY
jgi:hypothetical protein